METTVREQLLDSATQLFAENGFAGVTLQYIANKTGIDDAEITRLFGCVDKLYEEILEFQFSHYATTVGAVFEVSAGPLEKVELFARALCDFRKQSPYFSPLFYRELLSPSVYFESIIVKNIRHVAYLSDTNFAKGIQKTIFKHGVNPANATMFLAGMFHYLFLASPLVGSLLPETTNDAEYLSQALSVFMTGFKVDE